ncbi:uncharacterized protein SPSK_05473 [Sporothrix schenckii 1099-18]|uniref:Uncharacterized protein n=2 Tax=Sporothrix schenckii TaxID=29908 RepID=U7Q2U9_SPOS1|nr:uncharacterized protein SPSK_05473 [Sporothrix schenckii 1099-18]ERT02224.1 hypothetical protein HMPREF1624_00522 [Sporothrix schenckii ATCC 58251]KJR80547.1 hypothetical protein SPSK_05473 [Sporothrix schenckii 1099-18]
MASYPTAEDEKRLLAHAAETTTTTVTADSRKSKCSHACRRRVAKAKKVVHVTVTLAFVLACCIAVFGLGSLAIGTIRHARPCSKHSGAHSVGGAHRNGAAVVVADGAAPTGSSFSRLLEAVSPEALHDLLHEYLPNTYKHGVYPSEKHALEAVHRQNAALATSIVQLARRDLNSSTSSTAPISSTPSSTPTKSDSTTSLPSSTSKNSPTSASSTSSHTTSKSSSSDTTTSGRRVTNVFTSTVNGTPTVVTATSVVGAGPTNSAGSPTNSGTLQTGAAVPMGAGNKARFAEAVAGVIVGAMLI